jgi:hypothetical protein
MITRRQDAVTAWPAKAPEVALFPPVSQLKAPAGAATQVLVLQNNLLKLSWLARKHL